MTHSTCMCMHVVEACSQKSSENTLIDVNTVLDMDVRYHHVYPQ